MRLIGFTMIGLGMFCFASISASATWIIVPFLVLFAIGYGGLNTMRPTLVGQFFGRSRFGSVFGMLVGINMTGSVLGPIVGGWAYDTFHTYKLLWYVFMFLPIIALFSILSIRTPKKTQEAEKA